MPPAGKRRMTPAELRQKLRELVGHNEELVKHAAAQRSALLWFAAHLRAVYKECPAIRNSDEGMGILIAARKWLAQDGVTDPDGILDDIPLPEPEVKDQPKEHSA